MSDSHDDEYHKFTGPQREATAVQTLHGLVNGIVIDGVLRDRERDAMRSWLADHDDLKFRSTFAAMSIALQRDLIDANAYEQSVVEDLLDALHRLSDLEQFYDDDTKDTQRLHGIIAGIASDGRIELAELVSFRDWLNDHDHLAGLWPFEDISSVVREVLADGNIDAAEHELLLNLFASFLRDSDRRALDIPFTELDKPLSGICAHCPTVTFAESSFCFTGSSDRGSRSILREHVEQWGGEFHPKIRTSTDYLIVCGLGNDSWAYECYGRKVEKAMEMRRSGSKIMVVHEYDFWDALEDAG
ncbi:MAG: NAD-dependent DNA ligase [Planctomycetota bacterium]